jgi:hypothetical protein
VTYGRRCNWVNQNGVQCGQPLGHKTQHGNGLLTSGSRNDWHEYLGPVALASFAVLQPPLGVVHTDKSKVERCLWMGPFGRCIYETGHTIGHKEDHA